MSRMKDYKRNFVDGKPTEDFKRRSNMYTLRIRADGTTSFKLKPLKQNEQSKL